MNYHIGTMLIYEHFDGSCACPLCRIEKVVDARLTESYLGEKVMEDETRKEVNKLGFCKRHYDDLFALQSKLGLALQTSTRLKTIRGDILAPKNPKQAKKIADKLAEREKTCVVCKYLDEHMTRYYKTVAEVYLADENFRSKIADGQGFCLPHYGKLLAYSSYAGKLSEQYLSNLSGAEERRLENLADDVEEFCNHHDYRNADKPLTGGKDALKKARKTIYGE